jgi:hypothetical protein
MALMLAFESTKIAQGFDRFGKGVLKMKVRSELI